MIFTGDIACPNLEALPDIEIPEDLKRKAWISNLEGAIEINGDELLSEVVVFNQLSALQKIKEAIDIKVVTLANNHITDTSTIRQTEELLDELNVKYCGAGIDINSSKKACVIKEDNGKEVVILNFGWRSISCLEATGNKEGVNPYEKNNIISQVKYIKSKYDDRKIIVFFHWNYELELYPQPFDRELSYALIDLGVDAVIGCHAHRVQGAEIYKGKPIIYGLGNWIFPQSVFWNKRLKFPEFCSLQLAFEIDWDLNEYICHWFFYDREKNKINFIESEKLIHSERMVELTPYKKLNNKQYEKWFKKNRYHKKMLPVFYFDDKNYVIDLKNRWIQIRHFLIMSLVKFKNLIIS